MKKRICWKINIVKASIKETCEIFGIIIRFLLSGNEPEDYLEVVLFC